LIASARSPHVDILYRPSALGMKALITILQQILHLKNYGHTPDEAPPL